jgi:hypothetical protein
VAAPGWGAVGVVYYIEGEGNVLCVYGGGEGFGGEISGNGLFCGFWGGPGECWGRGVFDGDGLVGVEVEGRGDGFCACEEALQVDVYCEDVWGEEDLFVADEVFGELGEVGG